MQKADTAVLVRIRSRFGSFLGPDDYKKIAQMTSVSQISSYLSNNRVLYSALDNNHSGIVHRDVLEMFLKKSMLENLASLCSFDNAISGTVHDYVIKYVEVSLVIQMYLNKSMAEKAVVPVIIPEYFRKKIKFDYSISFAENDITKCIEQCKDLSIYPALKNLKLSVSDSENFLIELEGILYSYLFNCIIDDSKKYGKKSSENINKIIGIIADEYNMGVIWRCRKYYHHTEDKIERMLLPGGYRISKNRALEMLNQTDSEILEALNKMSYPVDSADDLLGVDKAINKVLYSVCRKSIQFSSSTAEVMIAFVMLFELQNENIFRLTEAIRYGVPPEKRLDYIVK